MTRLLAMIGVGREIDGMMILRNIDLSLAPGEFAVLIGGSGSGKTTLLRLVAGLDRVSRGEVRLRGNRVDSARDGIWVAPEQRQLGMVFQDYALWPHMTVLENVAAALPNGRRDRERAARAMLDLVGLGDHAGKRPQGLSGGQQQRVGIARALVARPDLILLDEPLSGLDVDIRENLRLELRSLTRESGAAALFVSHDPTDAWRLADRVIVLERGQIVQATSPAELYRLPETARVARFIGAQGGFTARTSRRDGVPGVELGGIFHPAPTDFRQASLSDERCLVLIRSAGIKRGDQGLLVSLSHTTFEGGLYRAYWHCPALDTVLYTLEQSPPQPGRGFLVIDPAHVLIYPNEME